MDWRKLSDKRESNASSTQHKLHQIGPPLVRAEKTALHA